MNATAGRLLEGDKSFSAADADRCRDRTKSWEETDLDQVVQLSNPRISNPLILGK